MSDSLALLHYSLAGRYEVEREIGRGGMATVYLARDVKHTRRVALKVLDPELGAVLGVERFLSEIRVTAGLQHPNLLPLFDSGEANGLLFYVMPFVDGESLRAKLDREKQLPVDEAVHIAVACANALAYAHGHGVIHRDLKPENILLQHGQPVVADFGIALAVSNAGGARVTQTGLSLGTPQYMSPEQATGDRGIDARTDIYSLGVMAYEMLTGEPPHTGTSAQAIIAKLMTEDPRRITVLRRAVPAHVEGAVHHALEKLPADRFATAAQFADALQGKGSLDSRMLGRTPAKSSRRARGVAVGSIAVAVLAAGAAVAGWWKATHPAQAPSTRFTISPPLGRSLADRIGLSIAITPDGGTIAYTSRLDGGPELTVRKLDELESRVFPGTVGAVDLRFSPDGRWISYLTLDRGLMKVSADGGQPSLMSRMGNWTGGSWNDESLVFIEGPNLMRMSPDGRSRKVLAQFRAAGVTGFTANDPFVLRDERLASFRVTDATGEHVAFVSLDSGPVTTLDISALNVLGYVDGWLIFGRRTGSIAAVRADLKAGKTSGDVIDLQDRVRAKFGGGVAAVIARQGNLAYLTGSGLASDGGIPTSLVVVDERGTTVFTGPEKRAYQFPSWSPDGRRIAIDIVERGAGGELTSDIWIIDVESKTLSRLTTNGGARPAWTPDGKRIGYGRELGGKSALYWIPVDGSGAEELIATGQRFREVEFSPNGRYLLTRTEATGDSKRDIWQIDLQGDRTPRPIIATGANELMPSVSPDSRWIAFQSDETGTPEIYIRPLGRAGGQIPVSAGGGREPRWTRDGRIIYRTEARRFVAAKVTAGPNAVSIVARDSLLADPYLSGTNARPFYDVHPDGKRLAAIVASDAESFNLVVVTNWLDDVRRKLNAR